MYVKKFEAETLDGALQAVKRELGPDAIILKTTTNKGLKGAFKKSRIEITAAISEGSYAKKSQVDHVLNDTQKEDFYKAPAQRVNNMINEFNEHKTPKKPLGNGYGQIGLNKVVNTVSNKIKNSLDDFLAIEEEPAQVHSSQKEVQADYYDEDDSWEEEVTNSLGGYSQGSNHFEDTKSQSHIQEQVKSQKHQIELLEQKLFELTEKMNHQNQKDNDSISLTSLRSTLRSLELSESIVQNILKKAVFELSSEEREDVDTLYEFALREIHSMINVEMPLFSKLDTSEEPVVTVLLSETSSGQSSMAMKLAALQENVKVLRFREDVRHEAQGNFVAEIFKIDLVDVTTLAHLMSEARKAIEEKRSVILDLRLCFKEMNEAKKFLETLKRSFSKVEFILNLSAIHAELYNKKVLSKYGSFVSGVNYTYVDQCLSFGSIVNLHNEYKKLPLKFFGTGTTVPDDIEMASVERIMAELFKL